MKRTVTIDALTPKSSLAKRLKRVERKQQLYGPSKLARTIHTFNSNVNDGAVSYVQLSSNGKIFRVQVRGFLGAEGVDAYLLQTPTQAVPVYADFTPTIGGCIANGKGPGETGLVVWKHYLSLNGGTNFSITQRFKYGFDTTYDAAFALTGKALWLVIKNDSGAQVTPQFTIEQWNNNQNTPD